MALGEILLLLGAVSSLRLLQRPAELGSMKRPVNTLESHMWEGTDNSDTSGVL